MNKKVASLIRPAILELSAYHVPPSKGLIKLDAMENPYPWPPEILDEWLSCLRDSELNRYPDASAHNLIERLRTVMNIPEGLEIMLGNGSDELIQIICMALADAQSKREVNNRVLSPEPSFVMYRLIAEIVNMDYVAVPLRTDDFTLDINAMLAAIKEHKPAIIFLAYPNNPTGNLYSQEDILSIIKAAPGLVVVDEAYYPFAQSTLLNHIADFDNLLVMRTVSKMGLAGLRLGFLVGKAEWIAEFNKLRLPYNINTLTQLSANFALQHITVFDQQAERIRNERQQMLGELRMFKTIRVYETAANFILIRTMANRASDIFEALKDKGILIKNLDKAGGVLKDCLRITVGTPEENARLLEFLTELL